MQYAQLDIADLERELATLAQRHSAVSGSNLSLDLTRGKPAPEQLDLANALDGILEGNYMSATGIDARNYGDLRGLPEARELGAEILGLDPDRIIADGPSSLTLMYQVIDAAYHYGLSGPAWSSETPVKAICPVPGYDRHFTITESFGIEMINVPMNADGPDMDQVEALVDASRKALLGKQPELVQPGGALYPEDRAEACWRDCYHFLRVSCYGAACAESAICDPDGMAALGELYALLGVPTDALQLALIELRTRACAAYTDAGATPQEVDVLKGAIAELERWISRFCG